MEINAICGYKQVGSKLKPAAQTTHLFFADTRANAKKTKRAVFCQRSNEMRKTVN